MPRFFTTPSLVQLQPAASARAPLEEDGGTEDAGVTLEDPSSPSDRGGQVFLLFPSNSELSEDELTQSVFGCALCL